MIADRLTLGVLVLAIVIGLGLFVPDLIALVREIRREQRAFDAFVNGEDGKHDA